MLRLENIVKVYNTYGNSVAALKGVSLDFRKSEFVAILGHSGCGKTTMLNIIGGLDHYTSGDLIINSKSTKDFTDNDWDSYRNHSVGFVFQSYNLIPHQTVLKNVELALTLSGVNKLERRKKAIEALTKVGLADHLNKKPNQMSGGQMQRVAIARSLVNDPEILLADEPTGALDTETSIQVMEILKEVAKDRLVIMVTHNPELADKYANRIIRVLDGKVVDDSNPYTIPNFEKKVFTKQEKKKEKKKKKVSMSFLTALSLSLNNLFTKKTRTLMVAFAGSIGIIGIALILSVSSGFQNYIDKVQEDTLSTYPLTVEKNTMDVSSLLENIAGVSTDSIPHDKDKIYSNDIMVELLESVNSQTHVNNLKDFKKSVEEDDELKEKMTAIKYTYSVNLNIYLADTSSSVVQVSPSNIFGAMMGGSYSMNAWSEMLDNPELLESQYDCIAGKWPTKYDEVVIVVDKDNEINDYTLYALGFKDQKELEGIIRKMAQGEEVKTTPTSYTYDEILSYKYKLVLGCDLYEKDETNIYNDISEDEEKLKVKVDNGLELSITGIVRPRSGVSATSISGTIGYRHDLVEYVINKTNESEIVKKQKENPNVNVFNGVLFMDDDIEMVDVYEWIDTLEPTERTEMQLYLAQYGEEKLIELLKSQNASYEGNLRKLSSVDLNDPQTISFYPVDFESKEYLEEFIKRYNEEAVEIDEGNEIRYTDYIGILLSSVSTIIDAISYVLIAFVAISLVVSSIMIGVITYISVLERIKEIGILRSIGASKKDISRVFNAETVIIGFTSGVLGIALTIVLCIPINLIINTLADIGNIAKLPVVGGIVLVFVSVLLTFIAGLIPSRIAANKDPVEALRSE